MQGPGGRGIGTVGRRGQCRVQQRTDLAATPARLQHAAEVFRAQGEAVWRAGGDQAAAGAETWLRRAHARALAQSAPAWALRAATSLGRVLQALSLIHI